MAVRVPLAMSSCLSISKGQKKKWQLCFESAFLEDIVVCSDEEANEDPAAGDEGLATGVEGPGMDDESYCLDNESHGLDDESHAPVLDIYERALGHGDGALLTSRESALEEDDVYSTFEVRHGSGSALESERPGRVSTSRQPTLTLRTDPEDVSYEIATMKLPDFSDQKCELNRKKSIGWPVERLSSLEGSKETSHEMTKSTSAKIVVLEFAVLSGKFTGV
ncbi:hypothetical protein Tco_0341405 [Tanacetum coccineum]